MFDFDGLILDTETPIFEAWQQGFADLGSELLLEEWAKVLGKATQSMDAVLDRVEDLKEPAARKTFIDRVSRQERKLIAGQAPMPGAVELIRKSHRNGVQLGVVSSSDQEWVHSHLERLGLLDYFHHTSCADEVEEAKPDPALYRLGLEKMDLAPDQVVVLEDSPNGVLAAKRAGLYCIAVPNELTSRLDWYENGGGPDQVLNSLNEFPWNEFMRMGE